jgi:hypothetical protein
MKHQKTVQGLIQLLREIKRRKTVEFSGVGLVVYNSENFPVQYCSSLRPSVECPKSISLSDIKKSAEFFCQLSCGSHSLHDGYHLIDANGKVTHVAQYLWPPIIKKIRPNESYGTRHLSAQYGSCMKEVIAVGIITHDGNIFCFTNGKNYKI